MNPVRWGIIGTGIVAGKFAQGLQSLPNTELLAIGSRSNTTAQNFATQFKVPRTYSSYAALVADRDIDVVYIATPHTHHLEHALLCLEAGKAVLCEKPFTLNAAEARAIVAMARQKKLFCMEAMWMRFFPAMAKVRELLEANAIGDLRMISASLGFQTEHDPNYRLFNPALGGGTLLDFGVYPLSFIFQILGRPTSVVSQLDIGSTGVDEQAAVLLGYPQGRMAVLTTSAQTRPANEAVIMGTTGQIQIHAPLLHPDRVSLTRYPAKVTRIKRNALNAAKPENLNFFRNLYRRLYPYLRRPSTVATTFTVPYVGNGYQYEAAEVNRCLAANQLESALMPLDDTIEIMKIMDDIRAQWNFKYPQEMNQT